MPENIVRVTLDIRPASKIDPGPLFERIQRLIEDSELEILGGQAYQIPSYLRGAPDDETTTKRCPDCETPNQFGELCARCAREAAEISEARSIA